MGRRRFLRYRISDLLLIIALAGFALELRRAVLVQNRIGTVVVCVATVVGLSGVLLLRPRIGSLRCPYCGRQGIESAQEASLFYCDECDTLCERSRRGFRILSSPSDERLWAIRFLPKLQTLRQEMRPRAETSATSNPSRSDHFLSK